MVYNNFILRLFFSAFFIFIYFIFAYINFEFVFYLVLLIYIFILIEIYINFNLYKYLPIIYLLISFIFFVLIDFGEIKIINFNLFILAVISFDIFSYVIGKSLGKNKLTRISPNKTYEGLFGGAFLSFLFCLIFAIFFDIIVNLEFIFYLLLIILSSFIGDIIESYFKRRNNIKNSSELIPGHGGVFDRFDSFLFSIIIYSIFINI